jgi:Ala-tRNA(Pro) deacylase
MVCKERLEQYFRENGIPFRHVTHPPAFTAPEAAAAQHVPGKQVAKVVLAKADDALVMCVVPANKHVDLRALARMVGVAEARLAREDEFSTLFADCELGAMPPFGNLYGIPVYLDVSLTDDPEIVFQAGTHTDSMKIRYPDYERLIHPQIVQVAM